MSNFLNLGNGKFQESIDSQIYVDKTWFIDKTNRLLSTRQKFACVTRPRRFGKSMAADMLEAFYCRTCDSHTQFDNLEVAKSDTYVKHINKYNVIHINVVEYINKNTDTRTGLSEIESNLIDDFNEAYPDIAFKKESVIPMIKKIYSETKAKFVFVIDEWDSPFREQKNDKDGHDDYLVFLRSLLKDQEYVALAYMTGILPIKKFCTDSSLNMFWEYSMLDPGFTKPYFGFTQYETKKLCDDWGRSYAEFKDWYDGYVFTSDPEDLHVCNSDSVISAIEKGTLKNYWSNTESYENLTQYIRDDRFGLHDVLQGLIEGKEYSFENVAPSNDIVTIESLEDILTILIHLGYLAYYDGTKSVYIPNHEVRANFIDTIRKMGDTPLTRLMNDSKTLLEATKAGDEEKVCELIKKIHTENTSVRRYKDEGTLSSIARLAYIYAMSKYKVLPEAQTGEGYADLLFDPLNYGVDKPLIIELESNRSAETAIKQIRDRDYVARFRKQGRKTEVLLIGINYQTDEGESRLNGVFTCKIETETV
ncbi:MAG: ATP-binding protein [Clostridia bacterium]|nr:ATP-binding protein [Clostridia bacterium]